MADFPTTELHFLLRPDGSLVAYREDGSSWAAIVAFSSADLASTFCRDSGINDAQIAAVDPTDSQSIAALVGQIKMSAIRFILLDLDYRSGRSVRIQLEADRLGERSDYQVTPARRG
jgi:hypothetical protein